MFKRTSQVGNAPEAPPALPANVPNGMAELGAGIAAAGDAAASIARHAFREQVEADVNGGLADFQKRLNERLWDDQSGFLHKKGEAAFDADKELPRVLDEDLAEIGGKLRSRQAREMFTQRVQPSLIAAQREVEQHVFQQGQAVKEGNFKALVAQTLEAVTLNPDQTDVLIEGRVGEVASYHKDMGAEVQGAAVREFVANARAQQIRALLGAQRYVDAKAAFDAHEPDLGAAAPAIHAQVLKAWLPQQGLEIANDITAKILDPRTGRVDARMRLEELSKIQDAQLRRTVEVQLGANVELANQQRRQEIGDLYAELYDSWKTRWSLKGLGAQLADLRRRGEDGADAHERLMRIVQHDIDEARQRRERARSGPETPEQRASKLNLWLAMSEHPEVFRAPEMTPSVFLQAYTSPLAERDKDMFDRLFVELKSQNWNTSVPKRALDLVNAQFRERFGAKWTPQKATPEQQGYYAATIGAVMTGVMGARGKGGELSERDLNGLVEQQFQSTEGEMWGLFGRQYRYEAAAKGTLSTFVPEQMDEALEDQAVREDVARRLTSLGRFGTIDASSPLVDRAIAEHFNPDFAGGVVQPQPLPPEEPLDAEPPAAPPPQPDPGPTAARVERANRTAELARQVDEQIAAEERQFQADVARAMAGGAEYQAAVLAAQGLAAARAEAAAKKKRDSRTFLGVRVPE